MNDAQYWIDRLDLEPHMEGGYFKETYRSVEHIDKHALPERFSGDRSFCTAIYFLLQNNDFSAFHRINQDELWHFYIGDPLIIHQQRMDIRERYTRRRHLFSWTTQNTHPYHREAI